MIIGLPETILVYESLLLKQYCCQGFVAGNKIPDNNS